MVDVRLIEAVEQDQTIGTRGIELLRNVAERGEEGRQLDSHRYLQQALHVCDDRDEPILDRTAGH
jgi:hypothetical protein